MCLMSASEGIANYSMLLTIYLLTTAESGEKDTPQHAIGGVEGWLKVFNKAKLRGVIFAGRTTADGTIRGHRELAEAEAMGRAV